MKFVKKHKLFSFVVISFIMLTGVNIFMIYQLLSIGTSVLLLSPFA